jgi:hypothetical protein
MKFLIILLEIDAEFLGLVRKNYHYLDDDSKSKIIQAAILKKAINFL